ncbi:unnamed protein product [Cuscuta epithymum]|uniref:Uncharacterized protein n=1 Tax=Cuscuta epithymum TaxID=186058 RepID=A0AAV0G355_9ASTE|nr:unnamed protein product [Cuscuta epithymum]
MDRLMWWYREFPMQVMKEEQGVLLIRPPPEPPPWSDREATIWWKMKISERVWSIYQLFHLLWISFCV